MRDKPLPRSANLESVRHAMEQARRTLEQYEQDQGIKGTPEHRSLERLFDQATALYLRLLKDDLLEI